MAFCRIPLNELFNYDLRLWDHHTRYDGRWSDEQLKQIVERFELPAGRAHYAIASFARSLVVDAKTDNLGVHFPRAKNWYANRYNADGDPYNSYYFRTRAADWLEANGYIEQSKGFHIPNDPGAGRESVAYTTQKLLDAIGDLVDPLEPRALTKRPETIILRDRPDKKCMKYTDTQETRAMRDQLRVFNDHFTTRELRHHGQMVEIHTLRRIFNGSFKRGGRLYCYGESYQGLPKAERLELTEIIDGIAQPFVETDFGAHHFRLAYAETGKRLPPGDPYDIEGFDRKLVKLAGLIAFNAENRRNAVGALINETGCSYHEAREVLTAVRRQHHRIKDHFFSDTGARLMRTDSDMSVEIMTRVMARTGRCPLPMHDSYLVPACDAEVLAEVMEEVAAEYGVVGGQDQNKEEISPTPTPSHYPYMEVTNSDELTSSVPEIGFNSSGTRLETHSDPPDGNKGEPDPPLDTFTTAKQPPGLTAEASERHIHVGGPYPCQKRRGYVGIFPGKVWTALGRLTGDWANGAPRDYATVREWDKLMYGASEFRDTFKLFDPDAKAAELPPLYPPNSYESQEIAARKVYRNVGHVDPETEYWLFLGVLAEQHEQDAMQPQCAQIGPDKIVQYARYIRRQERENAVAREKAKRKAFRETLRELRAAGVKIERPKRGPKLTGDE